MSVFQSREQLNTITKLISNTFDIKLHKVQHKLALAEGYKNVNAQALKLSKEPNITPLKKQSKLNIDEFSDEFLSEIINFEIFKTNLNGELIFIDVVAPRAIKFIFEGHYFTSEKWLTKSLFSLNYENEYEFEMNSPITVKDSDPHTLSCNLYFNFDEKANKENYRYHHSIAFIQSAIQSDFIIDDVDLLVNNPFIFEHLLNGSNIEQFNFFCNNKKIMNILTEKQKEKLYIRYINIIDFISQTPIYDFNNDQEFLYLLLNNEYFINGGIDDKKRDFIFKTLNHPPSNFFMPSINKNCIENSFVYHMIEGYFPIVDTLIDMKYTFNHTVTNAKQAVDEFDRYYSLNEIEANFFKHVSFALDFSINETLSEDNEDIAEFCVMDFIESLKYINYLSIDKESLNRILPFLPKNEVFSHSIEFYETNGNDNDWHGLPVIAAFFFNILDTDTPISEQKDKIKYYATIFFNILDNEILDTPIDLNSIQLEGDFTPLKEASTVRQMISIMSKL